MAASVNMVACYIFRERKDKMRKIQEFMKNRCGIDELNLLFLCLSLASYFICCILVEEDRIWVCGACVIFLLLCIYRMFSQNLEWRKKENQVFVKFCSFFRLAPEENEEERNRKRLEKKNRKTKKVKPQNTKRVEEVKEQIKEERKESEEKVVVAKDKQEDKREREKQEDELRLREEKREKERREREEKRKREEEKRAAEALAREQKKREQRKREQKFDPNYVYFNCPYCNQAIRIPKRQGKVKITCPTCKNKFIKET